MGLPVCESIGASPPEEEPDELPPEEELLLDEELEPPEELDELLDEELDELLLDEEPNTGGLVSEPLEPPPQAVSKAETATAARLVKSLCCMNTPTCPGFKLPPVRTVRQATNLSGKTVGYCFPISVFSSQKSPAERGNKWQSMIKRKR